MASYVRSGSIEVSPQLTGTLRVQRAHTYTPEDRKSLLGYRPSTPLLVNAMDVDSIADITAANVPDDGHFVISSGFTGGPGYAEVFYSDEFETWNVENVTVAPNVTTAPDGSQTADKITEDAGYGYHYIGEWPLPCDEGSQYRVTIYAKAGERTKMWLSYDVPGQDQPQVKFDLSAGTIILKEHCDSAGIEDEGDGWYRCWITWTALSSQSECAYYAQILDASGDPQYTGDGSSGFYIWGALVEVWKLLHLYAQGAKPGSIGTKTVLGGKTLYVFRPPYEHEVVWYVALDINGKPGAEYVVQPFLGVGTSIVLARLSGRGFSAADCHWPGAS